MSFCPTKRPAGAISKGKAQILLSLVAEVAEHKDEHLGGRRTNGISASNFEYGVFLGWFITRRDGFGTEPMGTYGYEKIGMYTDVSIKRLGFQPLKLDLVFAARHLVLLPSRPSSGRERFWMVTCKERSPQQSDPPNINHYQSALNDPKYA